MLSSLPLVLGAACVYAVFAVVMGLRRNIAVAKGTNLPYVVVPCDQTAQHWLMLSHYYAHIIRLFPKSWWEGWLDLTLTDSCYQLDFQRFTRHGDTLLFVSPFSIMVQVSNAEAIRQITSQREKFPKPWEMYTMLAMFGDNVVTTEGSVWKAHRKATAATFNEKNSALVFRETIVQTNGMINSWVGCQYSGNVNNKGNKIDKRNEPLTTVSADVTRLTINIIGYVGFGLRLLWPGQSLPSGTDATAAKYASLDAPEGYSLCFVDTLVQLLDKILFLLLFPRWLLRMVPLRKARVAVAAHENYVRYLDEMLDEKIEALKAGNTESTEREEKEGMDFMGALAQCSFGEFSGASSSTGQEGEKQHDQPERQAHGITNAPALSRDEILGNAFVLFLAGHETSANTIHFTLIHLATNPAAQRLLQRDIDKLVGDTDCSSWDYESLIGPMMTSAIAACINETLRVIPPTPAIPKQVSPQSDQTLSIEGRECVLPKGIFILVNAIKAHEDPRHWPYQESKLRPGHDDLRDYRPERWFEIQPGPCQQQSNGRDIVSRPRSETPESGAYDSDDGIDDSIQGSCQGDTSFFRPRRGAFLPFSDGPRRCLGRRVAQVQLMTVLLVLFQRYSIELAVDEWATEAQVKDMDRIARTDVYMMAQAASRKTMGRAVSVITLGLHGKTVPMRLVARGKESFVDWIE
ncbi:hypothetical protein E4U32_000525 [Claviceps aff. humidiphila group G2b]|nr:hypothetical protein E4U32_000525 [Claviceps aff. humidiphila group G2b]